MRLRLTTTAAFCATLSVSGGHTSLAPVPAAPRAAALVVMQRVDHPDTTAAEPMVVEHPSGTLFVAGYGAPWADRASEADRMFALYSLSRLWKSRDGGASWSRVDVGPGAKGVVGNSDVALASGPDGTLYFVSMRFDSTSGKWEGRRIAVGVSHDVGATWTWTVLSAHRLDDRPWVRVAPDGAAHVIWNDGRGVLHTVSRDRGHTWTTPARIASKGGSSNLAVGPAGEVAVRVTPLSASGPQFDAGVDSILVSSDGGATWRRHAAPGRRDWAKMDAKGVTPRWVEPLAWDSAGRLYSLWTNQREVWLARSVDRGATWTTWRLSTEPRFAYYPYLIARGDGDLVGTWFTGKADSLGWHVARIAVGRGPAPPRVVRSAPLPPTAAWPDTARANAPTPDPTGEYVAAAFLRDGTLGIATPLAAPRRVGFTWWRLTMK